MRCLSLLVWVVCFVVGVLGVFLIEEARMTFLSIWVVPPNIGSIMLNTGVLHLL